MKNNYTMKTRGAIALTIAFSLIFSGTYFAWLSPLNEYPNYQEITSVGTLVKPHETSHFTFDVTSEKKIIYRFDASHQGYEGPPPSTPPYFSVRIYDPNGDVIQSFEKLAYTMSSQTIAIKTFGTHKVEITNIDNTSILVNSYVQEIKNPARPLEPIGHWFIFMALPIIGLGIWFVTIKTENKLTD